VDDLLLVNLLFDSHFWQKRSIAISEAKKSLYGFKMRKIRKENKKRTKVEISGTFPVLCSNEGRQET